MSLRASAEALVVIDAENNPDLQPSRLLSHLDAQFAVSEAQAFADFTKGWMRGLARRLDRADVTMIYVETRNGKGYRADAVDKAMQRAIRHRVDNGSSPSVFVIVTGDQGFVSDVKALRDLDKYVIVAANPHRASRRLVKAAKEFVPL